MRILIVGGTSFVGRAIGWAAVESGHDLTVINRGVTPSDFPSSVTRLVGDRRRDLSALTGVAFDVTVDATAYRPGDVSALHAALGDRGGHHIQVSSVSAYNEPAITGAHEDDLTLINDPSVAPDDPVTAVTYGALKAASERAALEYFDDVTIVRPTYVIGAHDATLRFPYWVQRLRRGGAVAVPGPRTTALQYVDARDLGRFVLDLGEHHTLGEFHVAGPFPAPTFVDVIDQIAQRVAPAGTTLVEVDPDTVERRDLAHRFPLWPGRDGGALSTHDPRAAIAAGLTLRPLGESVDDVLTWWGERDWPDTWLDPRLEADLLASDIDDGESTRTRR